MDTYECKECGKSFKGSFNKKRNKGRVFCSIACKANNQKRMLIGENNPNYKNGAYVNESICKCGNKKDLRSKQCSECSNKSFPIGKKNEYYNNDDIIEAIYNSKTIIEASGKVKYNRKSISKYIEKNNIDISHFNASSSRPYLIEQLLKTNTKRLSSIRKIIFKYNLIENKCSSCGIPAEWNGEEMTLEVHHIDGNPLNNNIENLTILCPNCHSQTKNYKGKNIKSNN